jgi:hypothetical protein
MNFQSNGMEKNGKIIKWQICICCSLNTHTTAMTLQTIQETLTWSWISIKITHLWRGTRKSLLHFMWSGPWSAILDMGWILCHYQDSSTRWKLESPSKHDHGCGKSPPPYIRPLHGCPDLTDRIGFLKLAQNLLLCNLIFPWEVNILLTNTASSSRSPM